MNGKGFFYLHPEKDQSILLKTSARFSALFELVWKNPSLYKQKLLTSGKIYLVLSIISVGMFYIHIYIQFHY